MTPCDVGWLGLFFGLLLPAMVGAYFAGGARENRSITRDLNEHGFVCAHCRRNEAGAAD